MASQYVFSSGFKQQFSKALYSDLIQIYLHIAVLNQAIYKCLFWLMGVKNFARQWYKPDHFSDESFEVYTNVFLESLQVVVY